MKKTTSPSKEFARIEPESKKKAEGVGTVVPESEDSGDLATKSMAGSGSRIHGRPTRQQLYLGFLDTNRKWEATQATNRNQPRPSETIGVPYYSGNRRVEGTIPTQSGNNQHIRDAVSNLGQGGVFSVGVVQGAPFRQFTEYGSEGIRQVIQRRVNNPEQCGRTSQGIPGLAGSFSGRSCVNFQGNSGQSSAQWQGWVPRVIPGQNNNWGQVGNCRGNPGQGQEQFWNFPVNPGQGTNRGKVGGNQGIPGQCSDQGPYGSSELNPWQGSNLGHGGNCQGNSRVIPVLYTQLSGGFQQRQYGYMCPNLTPAWPGQTHPTPSTWWEGGWDDNEDFSSANLSDNVMFSQSAKRAGWSPGHRPDQCHVRRGAPQTVTSPYRQKGRHCLASSLRATEQHACRPRIKGSPLRASRCTQSAADSTKDTTAQPTGRRFILDKTNTIQPVGVAIPLSGNTSSHPVNATSAKAAVTSFECENNSIGPAKPEVASPTVPSHLSFTHPEASKCIDYEKLKLAQPADTNHLKPAKDPILLPANASTVQPSNHSYIRLVSTNVAYPVKTLYTQCEASSFSHSKSSSSSSQLPSIGIVPCANVNRARCEDSNPAKPAHTVADSLVQVRNDSMLKPAKTRYLPQAKIVFAEPAKTGSEQDKNVCSAQSTNDAAAQCTRINNDQIAHTGCSEENEISSVQHLTTLEKAENCKDLAKKNCKDLPHVIVQPCDGDLDALFIDLPEETLNDLDSSKDVTTKADTLEDLHIDTEVKAVLKNGQGMSGDAPDKNGQDLGVKKVEKGIQNLRNLLKGGMNLASSSMIKQSLFEEKTLSSAPIVKSMFPIIRRIKHLPKGKLVSPTSGPGQKTGFTSIRKSASTPSVELVSSVLTMSEPPYIENTQPPLSEKSAFLPTPAEETLSNEESDSTPDRKSDSLITQKACPLAISVPPGVYTDHRDLDEEDSDDDDLLSAPSHMQKLSDLKKFTELADDEKSIMSTNKTLFTSLSDSEPEGSDISGSLDLVAEDTKFSLDFLLTERKKLEENDRQLAEIEEELQDGIRKGGVCKLEFDGGDGLLPEHQQKLKTMEMAEQVIRERHPGLLVFTAERYKQLFSFPETLTLESCGFKAGKSRIDKNLTTLPPDMLSELLTQEVVLLCFQAISCPHAFLTWLFQLIHSHYLVTQKAYAIVHHVLRLPQSKVADWVPDVRTIARVFVNLGADHTSLCPRAGTLSAKDEQRAGQKVSRDRPDGDHQHQVEAPFKLENLRLVLRVIADVAHLRCTLYKVDDLLSIIMMVLKVSLDTQLKNAAVDYDIQVCLSSLLHAISAKDWPSQVAELCRRFPGLARHHHDRVHLVGLMPPCERGRHLQRRVAYATLHATIRGSEEPAVDTTHLRLRYLSPLLDQLHLKGNDVDFYLVSSIVSMVDLAVGNEPLPSQEKKALMMLISVLRNKMGDVREYIHIMDRTIAKDQMVRLTSKWTFMAKNMACKEQTIFAYATENEPIQIESVMLQDQNDDDDDDDDDGGDDDDDNGDDDDGEEKENEGEKKEEERKAEEEWEGSESGDAGDVAI